MFVAAAHDSLHVRLERVLAVMEVRVHEDQKEGVNGEVGREMRLKTAVGIDEERREGMVEVTAAFQLQRWLQFPVCCVSTQDTRPRDRPSGKPRPPPGMPFDRPSYGMCGACSNVVVSV